MKENEQLYKMIKERLDSEWLGSDGENTLNLSSEAARNALAIDLSWYIITKVKEMNLRPIECSCKECEK